jgi:hypothetical protein
LVQLNWKMAAMAATGATALVGWVAAPPRVATTVAARPQRSLVTAPPAVRVVRAPAVPETRPARRTVSPQRNPFRFPDPAPARRSIAAVIPGAVAPVAERTPVPYYLSGVAKGSVARDTDGQDQAVWTAVLGGGPTGVVLARVGDVVDGRYRVSRLDGESMTLVDQQDGHESTLTLGRRP